METLQRTANRGSVSTGFDVANSVKFDKGNDTTTVEFFERNVSSTGSRTTGTFSAWIKKLDVTTAQYLFTFGNVDNDNGRTFARFQTDGTLRVGGGSTVWRNTDKVFRDTSAWYHVVIAFDTTQSTANDRIKIYINGVQETSFDTTNNPSEDGILGLNFGKQAIGYNTIDSNSGFNGYMCEVVIQDGVASLPTEFGEFDSNTGIWIPKDASGATMGTNGSYLKFENAASMGAASAGNSFTVQNINQNDQATDTCTNNFCTWNPLWIYASNLTISQGGQQVFANAGAWQGAKGSVGLKNGRWYWEVKIPDANNAGFTGIQTQGESNIGSGNAQSNNSTYTRKGDGNDLFYYGGSESTSSHGGGNMSNNNIIGVFLDLESSTKTLRWFKNGSSYGSTIDLAGQSTSFTTREVFPFYANITDGNGAYFNFGGFSSYTISSAVSDSNGYGNFEYTPNDGTYDYYSICTKNLAEFG